MSFPVNKSCVLILALLFHFILRGELKSIMSSKQDVYYIVLDAGSSSTKAHIYKLMRDGPKLNLEQEFFKEAKPGLATLTEHPQALQKRLSTLIAFCKEEIPYHLQQSSSLWLLATGGFRLIPENTRNKTFLLIEKHLKRESIFKIEQVGMLSETEEGVLSWRTIKFLVDSDRVYGAIELGGASMQVTYAKSQPVSFDLQLSETNESLFTKSFLGVGLNEARHGNLIMLNNRTNHSENIMQSSCFIGGDASQWNFRKRNLTISTSQKVNTSDASSSSLHKACYESLYSSTQSIFSSQKSARGKLTSESSSKLTSSQHTTKDSAFFLFSNFYYILDDLKQFLDYPLFEAPLYKVKAGIYCDLSLKMCKGTTDKSSIVLPDSKTFSCLDSTYACILLTKILKFSYNDTIFVAKNLKGYRVSWTLGVILNKL